MEGNLHNLAAEYANRPADEQYSDHQVMLAAARENKALSRERTYNLRELRVIVNGEHGRADLQLESPRGVAAFTSWSFDQASRLATVPAGLMRRLPAALAADCLNWGLHEAAAVGTSAVALVKAPNGNPLPVLRAVTSETYGRVWQADLLDGAIATIGQDPQWGPAPTWSGTPYAGGMGDRDACFLYINGGSIVTDPSLRNAVRPIVNQAPGAGGTTGPADGLYRAIVVRNSEVGKSGIWIDCYLYRYICGNLIMWSAVVDRTFYRRHVGSKVLRDTVRELATIARKFAARPASMDEALIAGLIRLELASTADGVIDELRAIGATREDAIAAVAACEQFEAASPRSFWGVAQGLTRISQASGYDNERAELDKIAGLVLARGARRVAA